MDVMIAGVGMTPFGRHTTRSLRSLTEQAVTMAMADAGLSAADMGAVFFGNAVQGAIEGQYGIRGQIALQGVALGPVPIFNVENACASATSALHLAAMHVQSGASDIALAVGAEKMVHPDPAVSMTAFEGSWERADRHAVLARLTALGKGTETPPDAAAREIPHSVFMDVYSAFFKAHAANYGTTPQHLARIASKNHGHSVHNPNAQFQKPFTEEQILVATLVSWPFTLPMCSAISDGAAAAVVISAKAAKRLDAARLVRLRAAVMMHGGRRAAEDYAAHISRTASAKAYAMAGLGPKNIDLVECHDATAFGELQQSELLGFTPLGGGGELAMSGATTLGGRVPFNPSGGLESRGHPIGATGLAQIFELVTQLRGEAGTRQVDGARIALAENGGGLMGTEEAAIGITILERSA